MSATCPRCLQPLARNEVHEFAADCRDAGWTGIADVPRGTPAEPTAAQLLLIPIDAIGTEGNVRAELGDLAELAASIKERGLLQPITVHVSHTLGPRDLYVVDVGHRRLAAAQLAGLDVIPAIVHPDPASTSERSIDQLVENIQRADLNPLEEAQAFRAILDTEPKLTQARLAEQLGRSAPYVSNALRLLELDPAVQERLRTGELSAAHGKAIASLSTEHQKDLASRIREGHLSSHQVESEVSWRRQTEESEAARTARAERVLPRVLAVIEGSGLPKDTKLDISGDYYLKERLFAALKAAGWTELTNEYLRERPTDGKCDCSAVRVELGRKAVIVPACVDRRHWDRQTNLNNRGYEAERKQMERVREFLRLRLRSDREQTTALLARVTIWVIARNSGFWHLAEWAKGRQGDRPEPPAIWEELASLPDAELGGMLADHLAALFTDSSQYPLPWEQLAEQLAPPPDPIDAAGAAERVKVKRAARVAAAEATP